MRIDKKRLVKPLGKVLIDKLKEIEDSLHIHLDMYFTNKYSKNSGQLILDINHAEITNRNKLRKT